MREWRGLRAENEARAALVALEMAKDLSRGSGLSGDILDEVVQETAFRVFVRDDEQWRRVEPSTPMPGFVRGILRNVLRETKRSSFRLPGGNATSLLEKRPCGETQHHRSGPPEAGLDVAEAARDLSPGQAEVVRLVLQGLSLREAAGRLGITPEAVRSRKARAMAATANRRRRENLGVDPRTRWTADEEARQRGIVAARRRWVPRALREAADRLRPGEVDLLRRLNGHAFHSEIARDLGIGRKALERRVRRLRRRCLRLLPDLRAGT